MSLISEITGLSLSWPELQERIQIEMLGETCSPDLIVKKLASIEGALDIYCWYEGSQGLPKMGANFMKNLIFEPLYRLKQDAKVYLYSLKAWNFKKNITNMPSLTPLGEAINRINRAAIECISSSSFFQYCTQMSQENLYTFIQEELPKKEWLFKLSDNRRKSGRTVASLFNNEMSLFDCIKDLDVACAYSLMQYVEGYYLIQESVKKALFKGQKKIEVAFVLPNDESKYYLDFPKDIEKMLQLDFGRKLNGLEIRISFQFFQYGESSCARPYIDRRGKALHVGVEQMSSYFDYLSQRPPSLEQIQTPFLRDVIHSLNGGERI